MAGSNFLRAHIARDIRLDTDGLLSAESAIERFNDARIATSKDANKYMLAGIGLSVLYGVKVIGLRIDLVLFDYKIFELPYGLFVFCVASQICFLISISRFMDSRAYDRYLKAICEKKWPENSDYAYISLPNPNAWIEPSARLMTGIEGNSIAKFLASALFVIAGILLTALYCLPIATGIYFLCNFSEQANGKYNDFQYYAVLASTISSCLGLLVVLVMVGIDVDD